MTLWPSGAGLFLLFVGIVMVLVARGAFKRRRAAAHTARVSGVPATVMDFDHTEPETTFNERWNAERDRWIRWSFLSAFLVLAIYAIAVWVVAISMPGQGGDHRLRAVVDGFQRLPSEPAAPATTDNPDGPVAHQAEPAQDETTSPTTTTTNATSDTAAVASGFALDCAGGAGKVFPVLEDPIPTDEASLSAVAKGLREPAWSALRRLRATHPDMRLAGLAIIGSADRRPLSPERARYFGSNDGLAQARATVVGAALRNDPPEDVPPIVLILNAGTKIPGLQLPPTTADNRAVLLCAIWDQPTE